MATTPLTHPPRDARHGGVVPDAALRGLAVGRLALGLAALVAPRRLGRTFGLEMDPQVVYMTRIYGGRAMALGAGYLTAPAPERPRWQRLGLAVDAADTVAATGHLRRHDLPPSAAPALAALTGSYAAVGAARAIADLVAHHRRAT
ncbi:MAG: hypothetical protein M0P31_05155 [Solirubrobacteraceae bacterium]|nr:hypothetical protein [Solirubrobacteraceae bacterium]